MFTSVLLHYFW